MSCNGKLCVFGCFLLALVVIVVIPIPMLPPLVS